MLKDEAVAKAVEYVKSLDLDVGSIVDAVYFDAKQLDEMAKICPTEMVETYNSVRRQFRNRWVVYFEKPERLGQVVSHARHVVYVFESGEALLSSP